MRLQEKLAARRYWHATKDWWHCGHWWCIGCHWRHAIGEHERRRRAFFYHVRSTRHLLPKLRRDADGNWRRVDES